ncbi:DUF1802 family protein [Aerosakkonemataceae cyanobacterium BLCC-F50]|uniref:DUF1802 family protein n=1 Tax=Floridaenema flaviceps BLCC-F50 TaxID=3153642 RepID=A0ABV4XUC7_9CYAN
MQINLDTAIRLPVPDVEALIQGRMITAMPKMFIDPGRVFALCPTDVSSNLLPPEQYYRSNFLPIAQSAISQLNSEKATIKAWAKCELCQMLDQSEPLEIFSQLTIWKKEALQQMLLQRPYIFLIHLRVYLLPEPSEISANTQGQFTALPRSLSVTDNSPILSDTAFSQRRHQIENRIPPLYPELEELQNQVAQIAITNPKAKQLDEELKIFLGWSEVGSIPQIDSDLAWIKTITNIGKSPDGNSFEKLVRKSFIKLGFSNSDTNAKASLNPDGTGGAGGLDMYCEKPYPVVAECKATGGESVTDGTPAQLVKLGYKHLQNQYNNCIKLIMAAGKLNDHANQTAVGNKMNVIRPETLQKLVQVKADYPGSINLLELKICLENSPFGEDADKKVNNYIINVEKSIKLRSHIVESVKQLCESDSELPTVAEIKVQYNAKFAAGFNLTDKLVYDLLVELSSPLTGYLGRKKGSDGSDRFYYLRNLVVDTEEKLQ